MGSIAAGAWAQADKGETSVDKTVDLNPVVVTGTGTHQRLKILRHRYPSSPPTK